MTAVFSFKCAKCGEVHEDPPNFSFDAPNLYHRVPQIIPGYDKMPEYEKAKIVKFNSDLCVINFPSQPPARFIRTCLEVPIIGIEIPFFWSIWVSLSPEAFRRYVTTFESPNEVDQYIGYIANELPFYPDTLGLKVSTHPRSGSLRPYIKPVETDHPLALDYYRGLLVKRAQEITEFILHRD